MSITFDQRNAAARQHCSGCEHAIDLQDGSVRCDKAGTRLAFVSHKCPLDLWDHSSPILNEAPTLYSLCAERLTEEWAPVWQARILAAVVRRTDKAYIIPLDLYREASRHRSYQRKKTTP